METYLTDLEATDRDKKLEAIDIIGHKGGQETVDPLFDHLEREADRSIKERILLALENLLPRTNFISISRMLRSHDPFIRNGGVKILKKKGDNALECLTILSRDNDKDVRKFAIDALIDNSSEQAREILRERFSDQDINIVSTAIEYLGAMKDEKSIDPIEILLLNSDIPLLQCTALEALAKIGISHRYEQIVAKLDNNDDPLLRYSLLKFMGNSAPAATVFAYIEKVIDQGGELYAKEIVDAVEATIRRSPEAVLNSRLQTYLKRLQENTDSGSTRYELSRMLSQVDNRNLIDSARMEINDDDIMVVLAAVEIIGAHGNEDDLDRLEALAEKFEDNSMLEAIGDAVEQISSRCSD
jgi:HEAT repeat protein